jgi:uncharacterized protein
MSFCYAQLQTHDQERAKSFYQTMFGWTVTDSQPHYTELKTGGAIDAGVMPAPNPKGPAFWLPYIEVANLDAKLGQAEKLGGKTMVPPTDVPGKGRYAVLTDPSGAAIGLWEMVKK